MSIGPVVEEKSCHKLNMNDKEKRSIKTTLTQRLTHKRSGTLMTKLYELPILSGDKFGRVGDDSTHCTLLSISSPEILIYFICHPIYRMSKYDITLDNALKALKCLTFSLV